MRVSGFLITMAVVLASVGNGCAQPARAELKQGDIYELTLTRKMAQSDNRGGSGSAYDRDTLIERVVETGIDGVVLEYDLPRTATTQSASEWRFPARILKPGHGPIKLLNHIEMEARVDGWLAGGGMTRANCGQLIFTWNAFRIDCDPQSVTGIVERFDLTSFEVREGALYQPPDAKDPVPFKRAPQGSMFVAEAAINPEAVRRSRAEADVSVAKLMGRSLSLEEALRVRGMDAVSGKISVTFEMAAVGGAWRRTTITMIETSRPDGQVETQTTTETLERRRRPSA